MSLCPLPQTIIRMEALRYTDIEVDGSSMNNKHLIINVLDNPDKDNNDDGVQYRVNLNNYTPGSWNDFTITLIDAAEAFLYLDLQMGNYYHRGDYNNGGLIVIGGRPSQTVGFRVFNENGKTGVIVTGDVWFLL